MLRKHLPLIKLICLILIISSNQPFALANEVIKVQFVQRPPYMQMTEQGTVEGLLPTRVKQIFDRAGIAFEWDLTSVNRQWDALLKPNTMTCSIGWFKNPEREKIAKFTKAIYQDQPYILLARKQFSSAPLASLETILDTTGIRILLKNKYSYGPTIDDLVKKHSASVVLTDVESRQMVNLLIGNRADFMFTSKEEAHYLMGNSDTHSELQIVSPPNMPNGEKRYIACNQLVPDELIERLNAAMTF